MRGVALALVALVGASSPTLASDHREPLQHSGRAQHQSPRPTPELHQDHGQHAHDGDEQHQHHHDGSDLPSHIPPLTDADRAAAFPDVAGHTVHDKAIHYLLLFDQLEWLGTADAAGFAWENKGWIGRDINRFWFRTEGEREADHLETAHLHALYGRAVAPWWDLVVGIRQDFRPGSPQTWAAIGVQGLAPYWFEVEATAYVGAGGRTHFRFETEYELLLTNRLILQPLAEVEIYGRSDPARGLGRGLSSAEWGLRLRYELRRELAPYIGVVWDRKFFGTADFSRAADERTRGRRLAVGLRLWL